MPNPCPPALVTAPWPARLLAALLVAVAVPATAAGPLMLRGDTAATSGEWQTRPLVTIGEPLGAYTPPGILDGLAAFPHPEDPGLLRVLANHELHPQQGPDYRLANGTRLRGARISHFDLDRETFAVRDAGLAYRRIIDRTGREVTTAEQVNETGAESDGLTRLCSARGVTAGEHGFVDDLLLTGEEAGHDEGHGHGGSFWVLDVTARTLWAAPDVGRGAWENATPIASDDPDHVALLLGDDSLGAPLYLYVGRKRTTGDFLARNGLRAGQLYCWRDDGGHASPDTFHGSGRITTGRFVALRVRDPAQAGSAGHDAAGYLDGHRLRAAARARGCFGFSRPEDLHDDPANPRRAVFSSTGYGLRYPHDDWGAIYLVDVDVPRLAARLTLLYDGDDPDHGDAGIRNPDNLVWADDGYLYVQEDRAVVRGRFGANGIEASVWEVDPASGAARRIAEIDRDALPAGTRDGKAGRVGAWESSGIIDITGQLGYGHGATTLLATVQAHGVRGGTVTRDLVEGGQLVVLTRRPQAAIRSGAGLPTK